MSRDDECGGRSALTAATARDPVSRLIWTHIDDLCPEWVSLCALDLAALSSVFSCAPLVVIDNLAPFPDEEDEETFVSCVDTWRTLGAALVIASAYPLAVPPSLFGGRRLIGARDLTLSDSELRTWARRLCLSADPELALTTRGIPALVDAFRTSLPGLARRRALASAASRFVCEALLQPLPFSAVRLMAYMALLGAGSVGDLTSAGVDVRSDDLALLEEFYPFLGVSCAEGVFSCPPLDMATFASAFSGLRGAGGDARACASFLIDAASKGRALTAARLLSDDGLCDVVAGRPYFFLETGAFDLVHRAASHAGSREDARHRLDSSRRLAVIERAERIASLFEDPTASTRLSLHGLWGGGVPQGDVGGMGDLASDLEVTSWIAGELALPLAGRLQYGPEGSVGRRGAAPGADNQVSQADKPESRGGGRAPLPDARPFRTGAQPSSAVTPAALQDAAARLEAAALAADVGPCIRVSEELLGLAGRMNAFDRSLVRHFVFKCEILAGAAEHARSWVVPIEEACRSAARGPHPAGTAAEPSGQGLLPSDASASSGGAGRTDGLGPSDGAGPLGGDEFSDGGSLAAARMTLTDALRAADVSVLEALGSVRDPGGRAVARTRERLAAARLCLRRRGAAALEGELCLAEALVRTIQGDHAGARLHSADARERFAASGDQLGQLVGAALSFQSLMGVGETRRAEALLPAVRRMCRAWPVARTCGLESVLEALADCGSGRQVSSSRPDDPGVPLETVTVWTVARGVAQGETRSAADVASRVVADGDDVQVARVALGCRAMGPGCRALVEEMDPACARIVAAPTAPVPGEAGRADALDPCLHAAHEAAPLQVRLFGQASIVLNGHELFTRNWGRSGARDLVLLLAAVPGHRMDADRVVQALWPGQDAGLRRNSLSAVICMVRKMLGQHNGGPVYIARSGGDVVLDAGLLRSDVDEFLARCRELASLDLGCRELASLDLGSRVQAYRDSLSCGPAPRGGSPRALEDEKAAGPTAEEIAGPTSEQAAGLVGEKPADLERALRMATALMGAWERGLGAGVSLDRADGPWAEVLAGLHASYREAMVGAAHLASRAGRQLAAVAFLRSAMSVSRGAGRLEWMQAAALEELQRAAYAQVGGGVGAVVAARGRPSGADGPAGSQEGERPNYAPCLPSPGE